MVMRQETINKNNKLIAEFMKIPYNDGLYVNSYELMERFPQLDHSRRDLHFDNNWDWLMPVVEKCKSVWKQYPFDSDESVLIEEEIFNLDNTLSEFFNNNINAIYRRCIMFIKWYNGEEENISSE